MKRAIEVRKVKRGRGSIYRLDPPYVWQDKEWKYAIAKSLPAEVQYGFLGLPAGSLLFLVSEEGQRFKYGPKVMDLHHKAISEAAILKSIGYTIKSS